MINVKNKLNLNQKLNSSNTLNSRRIYHICPTLKLYVPNISVQFSNTFFLNKLSGMFFSEEFEDVL